MIQKDLNQGFEAYQFNSDNYCGAIKWLLLLAK